MHAHMELLQNIRPDWMRFNEGMDYISQSPQEMNRLSYGLSGETKQMLLYATVLDTYDNKQPFNNYNS